MSNIFTRQSEMVSFSRSVDFCPECAKQFNDWFKCGGAEDESMADVRKKIDEEGYTVHFKRQHGAYKEI